MLLKITALALSLSLGGGSGVFGVPEIQGIVRDSLAVHAENSANASSEIDASAAANIGGSTLLNQLGALPSSALLTFVHHHPDAVETLLSTPIAPREISRWWGSMAPAVKQKLLAVTPKLIGNLDGVPYATRDFANRAYLRETIRELTTSLSSGVGRGMNVKATNHMHMLAQIDQALHVQTGDPERTLVSLDTESPGRASIVIGDLESADYVSYLIPGMLFTIDGQVDDWTDTATTLYHDQRQWLERLGNRSKTVATVAWIGYQTPHLLNFGSLNLADEGASSLTQAIDGLLAIRGTNAPYISIMAHSYGSTAAMIALGSGDLEIDAFAIVGSPGGTAQNVSSLAVRNGNVFVGEAGGDPYVDTAFYGSDPGAASFGAHPMNVGGGVDSITSAILAASNGHNEYFRPGSESMRNFALIGIGEGGLVMGDPSTTIAAGRD